MNKERKQTGRANYVRGLAAIYLLFLTYRMLRDVFRGNTDMPVVSGVAALAFGAVAAALLYGEWKAYRFAQQHKDDPETWSDAPEEGGEAVGEEAEEPDEGGEE